MRTHRLWQLCGLALMGAGALQAAEPAARLTGVVNFPGLKLALVELPRIPSRNFDLRHTFGEGNRVADLEIKRIDPRTATVTMLSGPGREESVTAIPGAEANGVLNFNAADSFEVLDVYQRLTGCTVFRSSVVPGFKVDLKLAANTSRQQAALEIEKVFDAQGIVLQIRWPKFAFAVPKSELPRLARLTEPPPATPAPKDTQAAPGDEVLPPGLIKFAEAARSQVLDIYQELSGRTVLDAEDFFPAKVTVRTETALSRAEATWAVEAALFLAGVPLVPHDDKFVFALSSRDAVNTPVIPPNPAAAQIKNTEPLPPGLLKFRSAESLQVLKVYAQLIGREPVLESVPHARITIRNQTPLTRAEAIFALDAMAALNNLRFVTEGEDRVKLIATGQIRRVAAPIPPRPPIQPKP